MFGRIFTLTFSLLFVACAQPRYENIIADTNSSNPTSEKFSDCNLRFKKLDYCVVWAWEQKPVGRGTGALIFKILRANLLDQSSMPAEIKDAAVVLWMPSMDHGSTRVKVNKVDTGSFRATNVRFVMDGEWEIQFQIKDGNKVEDTAVAFINF